MTAWEFSNAGSTTSKSSIPLESYVIEKSQFGYEVLIDDKTGFVSKNRDYIVDPVSIEEIMLFYVRGRMK